MTDATRVAMLNANYLKARLEPHYPGALRRRAAAASRTSSSSICVRSSSRSGIDEQDVAKRLMDYGFHAPTVSFPVPAR